MSNDSVFDFTTLMQIILDKKIKEEMKRKAQSTFIQVYTQRNEPNKTKKKKLNGCEAVDGFVGFLNANTQNPLIQYAVPCCMWVAFRIKQQKGGMR